MSIQERSRAIMMRQYQQIKNRQQSMLMRAAQQIGFPSQEAKRSDQFVIYSR